MAGISKIEWTHRTWNPVTGCSKVSTGCAHCYAERFALRLKEMGNPRYKNGFRLTLHEDLLDLPLRWRIPSLIFVNSMSDLFHEDVPIEFIKSVFNTMVKADWHIFQVLTKRSERLKEIASLLPWSPNIWMGVSVELPRYYFRIDHLREVPAMVRFISCEPLLSELPNLPLEGIHWVIVGGESGPKARPIKPKWVESIRDQCKQKGVAFFFKQWGGIHKWRSGRKLNGKEYNEFPDTSHLRTFNGFQLSLWRK
jgi:protein gp37